MAHGSQNIGDTGLAARLARYEAGGAVAGEIEQARPAECPGDLADGFHRQVQAPREHFLRPGCLALGEGLMDKQQGLDRHALKLGRGEVADAGHGRKVLPVLEIEGNGAAPEQDQPGCIEPEHEDDEARKGGVDGDRLRRFHDEGGKSPADRTPCDARHGGTRKGG